MSDVMVKPCSKCKKGERMNKHSWCAQCNRDYQRERRTNPETREAHLEADKRRQRKFLYGITAEQFDALVLEQNGCCAVCNKPTEKLCVDHCHESGKIRGLLCNTCNAGIGLLGDTAEALMNAATYLIEREEN